MKFIPIFQEQFHGSRWDLDQLTDNKEILTITLSDANGRKIKLSFDSHTAYRKLDEGDAFITLSAMSKTGGTAKYFYRVEDSEFAAWFSRERCDDKPDRRLVHYSIAAANDIVDVLAIEPPILEVV